MIIVIGSVVTTSETHNAVLDLSLRHVARSRAEPGCIAHNVHADCEDPARLVFVEYWTDMPALLAHFDVPASRDFMKRLRKLSPTLPDMKIFDAERRQIA
ncbi:putative quinol monooxygenase [Hyphomonas sp.]|uniref:putative quinol monooxygenase n=1 Tax=Hyphomonas sp. TaxID=87 RepID=UPI0035640757